MELEEANSKAVCDMTMLSDEVEEHRSKEGVVDELHHCLQDVEVELKLKQNEVQCSSVVKSWEWILLYEHYQRVVLHSLVLTIYPFPIPIGIHCRVCDITISLMCLRM